MKTIVLSIILCSAFFSFGQVNESLDKNNVSLKASAVGHLFNDINGSEAGYEIPKGSGKHVIFNQSMWFGAMDANGQLRMAAEKYYLGTPGDFYAGPYSSNGSYSDANYISEYQPGMWKVSRTDIDAHVDEFAMNGSVANPHPTILNWPGNGDQALGTASILAPFIDLNSDGVYDPFAGDYPQIKGCEGLYIIMNDSESSVGGTGTASLDIEIHLLIYQYASTDFLKDITFLDVNIINRGSTDLFDFVSATYTDADIGGAFDDYMGSDPVRNVMYQYNGDLNDENSGGAQGYGAGAPAVGVMYLNQSMAHSGYYTSGASATQSDPSTAAQFWNYMNGKWRFGEDWYFGGTGFPGSAGSTGVPTNHMFTGANDPTHISTGGVDPGFEWSELTNNNPSGDRRMFCSSEQGTLVAGGRIEIRQAIIYGRDATKTSFENVDVMLAVADSVQAFYDAGLDECNDPFASVSSLEEVQFSVFPNPSQGKFTVELPNFVSGMRIQVVDVYGKLVHASEIEAIETTIDLNEAAGMYFVTVYGNGSYNTTKLMVE